MNIRYNQTLRRFEAEFSADFGGDLTAVKAAGFRTDGPPVWIWWTDKIKILNGLREHKPESGLTINQDAWEVYESLAKMDAKNVEVKQQFAEVKKKVKKEQTQEEQEKIAEPFIIPEGKLWLGLEDFSPKPPFISVLPAPPPHPTLLCHICHEPVFFYEKQNPPTCLWCETQTFGKKDLTSDSKSGRV